jgi:hypothetical protein
MRVVGVSACALDAHLIGLAQAIADSGTSAIIRPLGAVATFVRRHPRVRFIGFFNGPRRRCLRHRDEAAEPSGVQAVHRALDPVTTAA